MPVLILLLALLAGAVPAAAQTSTTSVDDLRSPARIRVMVGDEEYVSGRLQSATADSLLLMPRRPSLPPVAFSRASIRALEVSGGRDRAMWALGGATVGTLAGVLWAELDSPGPSDDADHLLRGVTRFAYGVTGALYGALAGWLGAPERWIPVRLRE